MKKRETYYKQTDKQSLKSGNVKEHVRDGSCVRVVGRRKKEE